MQETGCCNCTHFITYNPLDIYKSAQSPKLESRVIIGVIDDVISGVNNGIISEMIHCSMSP